jgi:hypothetical protein
VNRVSSRTRELTFSPLSFHDTGSVLEATDDQSNLVLELREKINIRLVGVVADQKEVARQILLSLFILSQVLAALFDEIDTDGSGAINRPEFRNMLQALHLHYRSAHETHPPHLT